MEVGAHYRQVVRATHSAQITTLQTVDIGLHRSLGRVECALHAEAGVDSEHKGDERKEEWHPEHEQPPNGSRLSCGRPARRRKAGGTKSVPRQGHNTPVPLKRSPPASFKRLLGSAPLPTA